MAIKFFGVVLFFSLTVIYPVQKNFNRGPNPSNGDGNANNTESIFQRSTVSHLNASEAEDPPKLLPVVTDYLWIYVVFVYLFTAVAMYLIITETKRIIQIRQRYLGTQSSVTDRTIRLSGIPPHLRSEQAIKETIENLEIGKVDSVMLCMNWKELDDLMAERMISLRKLEESWTVHLGHRRVERSLESLPVSQPSPPEPTADDDEDGEESTPLTGNHTQQAHITPYARDRPMTRIWFGFMKLQSRRIDAIDYYEENLRKLDEKIKAVRQKDFEPTPLAFVTMDSTAACVSNYLSVRKDDELIITSKWLSKRSSIQSQCNCSQILHQHQLTLSGKIPTYPDPIE